MFNFMSWFWGFKLGQLVGEGKSNSVSRKIEVNQGKYSVDWWAHKLCVDRRYVAAPLLTMARTGKLRKEKHDSGSGYDIVNAFVPDSITEEEALVMLSERVKKIKEDAKRRGVI